MTDQKSFESGNERTQQLEIKNEKLNTENAKFKVALEKIVKPSPEATSGKKTATIHSQKYTARR